MKIHSHGQLTPEQVKQLLDDVCPDCGADLDTGYECNGCSKDWQGLLTVLRNSPAKLTICHAPTLKGFAAAYAAWWGNAVVISPDKPRPEVAFTATPEGADLWVAQTPLAAWADFVGDDPAPEILRYVEDDGLTLPGSREIRAFIATLPRSVEGLQEWVEFDRFQAWVAGTAILRFAQLPLSERASFLYEEVKDDEETLP